jgi:hypothetical protein
MFFLDLRQGHGQPQAFHGPNFGFHYLRALTLIKLCLFLFIFYLFSGVPNGYPLSQKFSKIEIVPLESGGIFITLYNMLLQH